MKVVGISGSPRIGNSDRMLDEAIRGCEEAGAETKAVRLRKLRWRGCCGRDECFHDRNCIIKDGIAPLMEEIDSADAIILASPSYFNNVSGLMKDFMDRTNPYCKGKAWKAKRAVILAVGGANMRSVGRCAEAMEEFFRIHGIAIVVSVCAVAEKPGEVDAAKLKECFEAGRKLVAPNKP
jgi:multimeric flavodoxin WrbA